MRKSDTLGGTIESKSFKKENIRDVGIGIAITITHKGVFPFNSKKRIK